MAYQTIHVFVANVKVFELMKTELCTKEIGEFSIVLYRKMGWWHSFALQDKMAATILSIEIF